MGLGIRIGAELKPTGILRRRVEPRKVLRTIAGCIPEVIGHPLHRKLAKITLDQEWLDARLHPAEEPMRFRFNEGGMLIVSAKTSSAGPGYYYESSEENGSITVYWYGDRTVRGSSFSAERESSDAGEQDPLSHSGSLRFTDGHLTGSADVEKAEEAGQSYWMLKGVVSTRTGETNASVCIVTVCFTDPKDRDWAVETWRSVYRGPEQPPDHGGE